MQNKKYENGIFVVSLDFELLWGMLDCADEGTYGKNVSGGRQAVYKILDMFQKYGIHATWGVVGFIYHDNRFQIEKNDNIIVPTYNNSRLSTYNYLSKIKTSNRNYYFAPEIISDIRLTVGQEIATHTYSHYYCCESGQTKEQFEYDLKTAIHIARNNGDDIKSIIFPRNQWNPEYNKILQDNGINVYRGNEDSWYYHATTCDGIIRMITRGFRLMDAYFNLSGMHCYSFEELLMDGLINVKSSRFLRPYSHKLRLLERVRINRIKKQMLYAAKCGKVFHIWWHPHNMGIYTEKNLQILDEILSFYIQLKDQYNMKSMNMQEVAILVRERNG